MGQKPLTDAQCEEALEYLARYGDKQKAADALGISRSTFQSRIRTAENRKGGMIVTGRSTLTDLRTGEPVMEWVKCDRSAHMRRQTQRKSGRSNNPISTAAVP